MHLLRTFRKNQLVVGAVAVPLMLYLLVAWSDYRHTIADSERQAQATAALFARHATSVFQTHKLIASLVITRTRGMNWEEIAASHPLHDYLAGLVAEFPQVRSIWLADPDGNIRNSSAVFPEPRVNVADRDYFALQRADTGLFIGRLVHGRVFNENIFNVVQRRNGAAGAFDGVVIISAHPTYFEDFWNEVGGSQTSSGLVREDGGIIARYPPHRDDLQQLPPDSNLRKAMLSAPAGLYRAVSPIDHVTRLLAYHKLADFPVFATYGINFEKALTEWRHHLASYAALFGASMIGLVTMAMIAERRSKQKSLALAKVSDTASRLREEINYRRLVEGHLRQLQKTEAAGQLAGGMAHDFRNVLTVIIANLEVLMLRHKDDRDQRALLRARTVAERGAASVQSMMAFLRKAPAKAELIDLNEVVRIEMLRQAVTSSIQLRTDASRTPCIVHVDLALLEMALLNLVFNARDAMMPAGGVLTLATRIVTLEDAAAGLVGVHCALSVTDTGPGMSPEVLEQVMTPFFTTKGDNGTGLGLSMVKAFANAARGSIDIKSRQGCGTTITLYLPLAIDAQLSTGEGRRTQMQGESGQFRPWPAGCPS